jgi:hypothetical protein
MCVQPRAAARAMGRKAIHSHIRFAAITSLSRRTTTLQPARVACCTMVKARADRQMESTNMKANR